LFDEWSRKTRTGNYHPDSNREQWESWDTESCGEPVTIASIYDAARQMGFDMRRVSSAANGQNGGRSRAPDHAEVAAALWMELCDGGGCSSRLLQTAGAWWEYSDEGWKQKTLTDIKQIVTTMMQGRKEFCPYCSTSYVNSVLMHLGAFTYCGTQAPVGSWISDRTVESADNWIAFSDGSVVNVMQLALMVLRQQRGGTETLYRKKSPAFFSKNFAAYPFIPNGQCPKFQRYLDRIMPDPENQRMLQQLAGLALSDITHFEKMWFLTGGGANGKSVFADILAHLVGVQNVCNLDIKQMGERYLGWPLTENKLNISNDLTAVDASHMAKVEGFLKQIVSGQRLNVERKFHDTTTKKCTARLIFVTNSLPAFSDQSNAIFRRTVIIPFLENIPPEEQDQALTQRIVGSELPGVFTWAIRGLADVLGRSCVFESAASLATKERHFASCNLEKTFLNTYYQQNHTGFISSQRLHEQYQHWCEQNDCNPVGVTAFKKIVETVFPFVTDGQRTVEGIRQRGFVGISRKSQEEEVRIEREAIGVELMG